MLCAVRTARKLLPGRVQVRSPIYPATSSCLNCLPGTVANACFFISRGDATGALATILTDCPYGDGVDEAKVGRSQILTAV